MIPGSPPRLCWAALIAFHMAAALAIDTVLAAPRSYTISLLTSSTLPRKAVSGSKPRELGNWLLLRGDGSEFSLPISSSGLWIMPWANISNCKKLLCVLYYFFQFAASPTAWAIMGKAIPDAGAARLWMSRRACCRARWLCLCLPMETAWAPEERAPALWAWPRVKWFKIREA